MNVDGIQYLTFDLSTLKSDLAAKDLASHGIRMKENEEYKSKASRIYNINEFVGLDFNSSQRAADDRQRWERLSPTSAVVPLLPQSGSSRAQESSK